MFIRRAKSGQKGQGMTEYIIIVALIAVAAITVVSLFGGRIKTMFNTSADKMGADASGTVADPTTKNFAEDAPPAQ